MTASGPLAAAPEAEHSAASRTGAPAAGPEPLRTVPRPAPGRSVVDLGVPAGGLTARHATWGVDGGEVLLTGAAPFVDLSGRAGFRSDGTLDGTVSMRGVVRLLGLQVAETTWSVAGWEGAPLAAPAVRLCGTTLEIDLTPVGAEVALHATEGLPVARTPAGAAVALPDGALPPGLPLEPRVAELFRGLRGWDVTGLRAHPDSPVGTAPAFVSNADLFFAPGRYGLDSPETAALLDAAVRAAVAGIVGPVTPTPPAPPPEPAPGTGSRPVPGTDPVPATVPPVPAAPAVAGEEPAGGAAPAPGLATAGVPAGAVPAGGGTDGPDAAPPVDLLMPPAPTAPGPAATARAGAVAAGAGAAARAAADLPSAEQTVADARGAVTEPASETAARAREGLAAALGERPAPSPEIVALCDRIRVAIAAARPVDEDDLLTADPARAAQTAGATVSGSVEGQVGEIHAGYAELNDPPPGTPVLTPAPVGEPATAAAGMGVGAATAAPDPIPPENLSLDADVAATDERIAGSGIDNPVTRQIPGAPFATVRDSRGELGEMAAQTPGQLAAEQNAAIETARADMAALQARAAQALVASRAATAGDVMGGQDEAVRNEEQTRDAVAQRAQAVFTTAQQRVTTLLEPLSRTAMSRWTAGLARLSQEFHDSLDRVQRWVDERHSGAGGFIVGIGDAVFGLPDWVEQEYDRAERKFGDDICELLLEISADVNGVVAAAQAIIGQARDDIGAAFTAMQEQFPEWAAQERARFSGMLDGLGRQVTAAQTGFVQEVSRAALNAVTEARAAVEERRQAARGVLGRIAAAIQEFADDPVRAVINALLTLVNIPPGAFWALVARIQQVAADIAGDPVGFANNLIAGVRQGFQQFFDNFGTHMLRGFWNWLFSGLDTPVPMPSDLSPRSLFTFALQLMGITWPRVREILVRHIGEQNVEIAEAAWQLISLLVEQGPQGIADMIKERLTPESIVRTILEAAIEYLVETLITQVVIRVIGMLNPAGAAAQALKAIYDVCAWIFRNAARIFRFVEAVVNGLADVVAGNITGLANAVERALAMLLPPVIDFFAGMLSLNGLPAQVAGVIVALQARVYAVMDVVIGFLAERARALLRALGLGGDEKKKDEGGADDELGSTVRFTAGGESHRVFVRTEGDAATLMVASGALPIGEKVDEWRGRLGELPALLHASTTTKLDALAAAVTAADHLADQLAPGFAAAGPGAGGGAKAPSDADLEAGERSIATMLDELFDIFEGEGATPLWLAEMATRLPPEGAGRAGEVVADWRAQLAEFTIGNQPADTRLWTDTVLDGVETGAQAVMTDPGRHRLLLPYFQSAPGRRTVQSDAFQAYVFTLTNPPHSVQRTFRQAYGQAAVSNLKAEALSRIAAAANVGPAVQDRWRARVDEIAFRWSTPGGGSITWPTGRVPDHERFRPEKITLVEANGVRTITYRTEAGQQFTVVRDAGAGLSITVKGENLRFRSQSSRGVTEDSPAFRSGNGFDRSHIIADEFSGSGWAAGGNLVTASAHYNQNVMRKAERLIGNQIKDWAGLHQRDETTVSFTMTVRVSFGALLDPAALAEIKQASWFPAAGAGRDLDAEIRAKINSGEVHPDLMRITGVVYQWEFTDPAGPGGTYSIEEDLWLLVDG